MGGMLPTEEMSALRIGLNVARERERKGLDAAAVRELIDDLRRLIEAPVIDRND